MKLSHKPLLFIDTETSGLDPEANDILEIALIYVEDGVPVYHYDSLVKMERPENAHPKALEINGYDAVEWEGAPSIVQVLHEIEPFFKGCVVAGHNPDFDMAFLKASFKRHGIPVELPYQLIDTTTLAYEHLAPLGLNSLSLVNVAKFLRIPHEHAHTALADAETSMAIYRKLTRANALNRLWWRLRA